MTPGTRLRLTVGLDLVPATNLSDPPINYPRGTIIEFLGFDKLCGEPGAIRAHLCPKNPNTLIYKSEYEIIKGIKRNLPMWF